ncbi:AMP-binding protein, partial [Roseibium sp. RKSG952]|uniref:AMP-binding protein n=1 Tax=Roseibium sp. RKSG952 TaxID=2529384 RepID=UPI0012BCA308
IIYTSGSTGKPKGVCVQHAAITALVHHAYPSVRKGGHLLQTGHPVFDAVTFEYWLPLSFGGSLILPQDRVVQATTIREAARSGPIDTLWLTSGLFTSIVQQDVTVFSGVGALLVGGDAIDREAIARLNTLEQPPVLINGYGPTETTTFAVVGPIPASAATGTIPLGKPMMNGRINVVDRFFNPVPIGVAGELLIGGVQVSRGYLGRPGLTAQMFMADPVSGEEGARLYRTGDLARWQADGTLEFLGRIDGQVK